MIIYTGHLVMSNTFSYIARSATAINAVTKSCTKHIPAIITYMIVDKRYRYKKI